MFNNNKKTNNLRSHCQNGLHHPAPVQVVGLMWTALGWRVMGKVVVGSEGRWSEAVKVQAKTHD